MKRIITAAALAAALLAGAPRAAAVCPYTVGALCVGRPGLFCCCCRPGAGLFLPFAGGVRFFT